MAHKIIESFKRSMTNRIIIIMLIAFVMTIPLNMVAGVVNERNHYYDSVIREISSLWGEQQTLSGPVMVVPFMEKHETEEALQTGFGHTETKLKTKYVRKHAIILPKKLTLDVGLKESYRQRGIYRSLVYGANIGLSAEFAPIDINQLSPRVDEVLLDEAKLLIGLGDTKAIDQIEAIQLNRDKLNVVAGVGGSGVLASGFSAELPRGFELNKNNNFDLVMDVKGSHGFHFAPFGETTLAKFHSSWPHPKFSGQLLPDNHTVTDEGFNAEWQVPHLARNYPQTWVNEHREVNLNELLAGVSLFEPVFVYSKITRAVKYGLLFIMLTFITFFIFEASTASALHYVQYGVVGSALAFFFLLLLALSEHIRFGFAYFIAALSCTSMISVYASYALANRCQGTGLFCLLSGLFGVIYLLLKTEDFALLSGTFMLLMALLGIMFVTKDINLGKREDTVN